LAEASNLSVVHPLPKSGKPWLYMPSVAHHEPVKDPWVAIVFAGRTGHCRCSYMCTIVSVILIRKRRTYKSRGVLIFSASLVRLALLHACHQLRSYERPSHLTGEIDLKTQGRSFSISCSSSRLLRTSCSFSASVDSFLGATEGSRSG